jgi:hypothetical protein
MKKTVLILLAILIGLIPSVLPAQENPPDISVIFSVDQDAYTDPLTPVNATISIRNKETTPFWVNSDFLTRNYYLSIKIIDPSGRSLPIKQQPGTLSEHTMQPLGFISVGETAVEVAPCMQMPESTDPVTVNLRDYYDLSIPGRYLAQVQLDMMAFPSEICDIRNYRWQGLVESEVISFYMEGDTKVSVSPNWWPLGWKDETSVPGAVTATLTPPTGVQVNQLETRAIYLNTVYSGDAIVNGSSLMVTFDGREAIDSLGPGPIERGKAYKVRVAGWYKGGGYFGGMANINVGLYLFQGFFSPVDNPPSVNSAKAGQAIPVKWRLTDGSGNPVSDTTSFGGLSSTTMDCDSLAAAAESAKSEPSAGSSGLQYLGDGNWQYNWKTPKSYAKTCRIMELTLKDGSSYTASFKFK